MSRGSKKVLIIDYGMGNIRSLTAAVEHLGFEAVVSGDTSEVSRAEIIMLPGVGSFPVAMTEILNRGLDRGIRDAMQAGKSKLLGICLGMQLFLSSSKEGQETKGLGLVGGTVERFQSENSLPVPHIGFNSVRSRRGSVLFDGLSAESDFYFVHSYRAVATEPRALCATSEYGEDFVAALEVDNIYGTQFHPEKSQTNGLKLLDNFLSTEIR